MRRKKPGGDADSGARVSIAANKKTGRGYRPVFML